MQISSKVALSISAVVALRGQDASRREQFCEKSKEAIQLLALAVAPAVADEHHQRVQDVLDNIAIFTERYPDVREIDVVSRDGRVVAARDPRRFNTVLSGAQLGNDQGLTASICRRETASELTVVVPMRVSHSLGFIRAHFSEGRLVASLRRQQSLAVVLLLATMLLIGVSLHLMHRRLVARRLAVLNRAAGQLGDGEMDVRADVIGDDEIAALGQSFNDMAKALGHYTEDLEQIIAERTEELELANERLEQLATTDQLTGLFNRRYFDEQARRALEVARRNKRPLSLVLVDTDRFKSVNDRFGHPAGDSILKDVAAVLRDNARKADLVARIGGEEFTVLMPEASAELAAQAAERMRAALEESKHPEVPELGDEPITASFGVAELGADCARLEDLLGAADAAMYASKSNGRNQVTVST